DEPLRRVAKDHRLLRAPGMGILMRELSARDQHPGIDQRLDDGLVRVALLAFVCEYALAGEPRRLCRERAVLVDGVGNRGVDTVMRETARVGGPHFKVLAPVSRCGMDEPGAYVIGDVFSLQERDRKVVSGIEIFERMRAIDRP